MDVTSDVRTAFPITSLLLSNDAFLPAQLPGRVSEVSAERTLLIELLWTAIRDLTVSLAPTCWETRQHAWKEDAAIWVADETDVPFGFLWVCEHLGIQDIERFRNLLLARGLFPNEDH